MATTCKYHCRACGRHFRSERGFNKHRAGTHEPNTRHCVEPEGKPAAGDCKIAGAEVIKNVEVFA